MAAQILLYEKVVYEPEGIKYKKPESTHRYYPDFRLNNGIYLEIKDIFTSKDRKKHLAFRESNPQYDVRFVFANVNKKTVSDNLKKNKKETNKSWCEKHNFMYCEKTIPESWFLEEKRLK